MNWRSLPLKDNKTRKGFYKSDEYTGKIPWRLKIGRDSLPFAIDKVKQQEQTDDRKEWIASAEYWLKYRSSGTSITKDEIKVRKKELGKILTEYNRYYSEGDIIPF